MLSRFLGGAVLTIYFLWRSCSVRKNGVYSGHLYTQRIYKNFDADVERAGGRGVQNFWGATEVERAKGATEAGAFGQRGKRGRL